MEKQGKFFYGWVMMAATFVGMGLVNYFGVSSFSLFVAPVVSTLGISATAFLLCATMNSLGGVFGAMVGGRLLDARGLRFTGTAGALLLAGAFFALRFAKSMPVFYLCYLVIGFASSATGSIFINKMVARWFDRLRGTVTGICTAGQSTFTFLLARLLAGRIERAGYASAYLIIAIAMLAVAVMLLVLIREKPEDMGQLPDGALQKAEGNKGAADAFGLTAKEATKTAAFWLIVIAYGLNTMASLGVIQTYVAHFTSAGYSAMMAATAASVYGLAGIFTRIIWGRIADKLSHKTCCLIGNVIFIGSILFLASVRSAGSSLPLYIFGIAFAFGNGFMFVLMVKFLGINFGTRAFGMLSGYTMTAMMLGSMAGSPLAGMIFDATGSYSAAYLIFAGAAAVSTVLLLLTKQPEAMKR